ncbi:NAD(P)/FAD-dependent oxidoreductase [Bacillus solitudinis]|uniref:NAD(P)/FAD-dependent oxidoreductase n=1 Tax=Bacillus solitudinis TaxID=2014074 RepID=UPI000C2479CA|nr:FAD-dependent oxidoreductase [Bacillus solitudinis]
MSSYIIVGAGILGASTAYHLAKSGAKVMIIDRNDKGKATEAAAGIVCPWLSQRRNQAWYLLAKNGAKYYPTLIKELQLEGEMNTGYEKIGVLSLHREEKKLDNMIERAKKRRIDAPEIGEIIKLSEEETKALFPALSDEYRSVHVKGAARVDGKELCEALIRAALRHGATLRKASAELLFEKDRVIGVELEEGSERLLADKVIVTAGAWVKELLKPLGINFQIEPQKAQIVHLELPNTDTSRWPVVMSPTSHYLLAFEGGRIVVGATHENGMGYDARVTAGGLHEIFEKAFTIAPSLGNGTVVETKVGFRPVAPGFLPVIGPIPNFKEVLVANGLGSSGLTVGPYLGLQLAKLALGLKIELNLEDYNVAGCIEYVDHDTKRDLIDY